ncbi:MAG: GIY-YIG nuclease family protein [Anaerolineales bacterium]|nr:GIY-YIG nuclease family protein [Anaerolineales bacterium]
MKSSPQLSTVQHPPPSPGLYALILQMPQDLKIWIGAFNEHLFPAGKYVYIGSARGPGGLRGRIARHMRKTGKRRHWHIDYLVEKTILKAVRWTENEAFSECSLAAGLAIYGRQYPPRFGASDCRCAGHLIFLENHKGLLILQNALPGSMQIRVDRPDKTSPQDAGSASQEIGLTM